MNTNTRSFWLAKIFFKGAAGLTLLFYLGFIVAALLLYFNPELFKNIDASKAFEAGFTMKFSSNNTMEPVLRLSNISTVMICWLVVRGTIFSALFFTILMRILDVIDSIQTGNTFFSNNIRNFTLIGRYFLIIFIVSSFNFYLSDDTRQYDFTIALAPLIISVVAFLIREVFISGKSLQDENQSII